MRRSKRRYLSKGCDVEEGDLISPVIIIALCQRYRLAQVTDSTAI